MIHGIPYFTFVVAPRFGNKVLEISMDSWSWKYGVRLFDLDIGFMWKGDHSPYFNLFLMVLNVKLIEIGFYDVRHEDDK